MTRRFRLLLAWFAVLPRAVSHAQVPAVLRGTAALGCAAGTGCAIEAARLR